MTLWKWSQVAATNATADSTINWAEGQAPSSVNDSARGMMAAISKYRDDVAGSIVTTGTSTAYVLASNELFDTLAHLHNQQIAFVPNVTNGAGPVTLNVDSTGAKPIRLVPAIDLAPGVLRQGVPYVVTYNNTDGAFYLQNAINAGQDIGQIVPFVIDPGATICARGAVATGLERYVEPDGSVYNIATFPGLGGKLLATYGGNGTTTFGVPNFKTAGKFLRHRTATIAVGTAQANQNLTHTHTYSGSAATGSENEVHTHNFSLSVAGSTDTAPDHVHTYTVTSTAGAGVTTGGSSVNQVTALTPVSTSAAGSHTHAVTANGSSVTLNENALHDHNFSWSGTTATGSADGTEARPEAFVVYYAIKT